MKQTMEILQNGGELAGITIAGIVAMGAIALEATKTAYIRSLRSRLSPEQQEAFTSPESMLPFYGFVNDEAEKLGLRLVARGGLAKASIGDTGSEIDVENKTISPGSESLADATTYRGSKRDIRRRRPRQEWTPRDLDYGLIELVDENGEWVKATPEHMSLIEKRKEQLQEAVDFFGQDLGFASGQAPEVSIFPYESRDGYESYHYKHYASRTVLEGDEEVLIHSATDEFRVPSEQGWKPGDRWRLVFKDNEGREVSIWTESPARLRERTDTRYAVQRRRDKQNVAAIDACLDRQGLTRYFEEERKPYQEFRAQLDTVARLRTVIHHLRHREPEIAKEHAKFMALKYTRPIVENYLSPMIRDREPRWRIARKIAGFSRKVSNTV